MTNGSDSERNRVVVHRKNGTLLKGYTHDFNPARETFHLVSDEGASSGRVEAVRVADCMAVFFVKTHEGDRFYSERKCFDEVDATKLKGLKIKVTFPDGEVIRGVTLGYNRNKKGFFIVPVDSESNNTRIYVVADAAAKIGVGDEADR